jgi:hypothetical protein
MSAQDFLGGLTLFRDDIAADGGLDALVSYAEAHVPRNKRAVEAAIVKVIRIIEAAQRSRTGALIIREAFSTSDFPLAFSWYTDRLMLAAYLEYPATWMRFLKRSTVPDFRAAARDRMQGLNGAMGKVAETEDYQHNQNLSGSRDTSLQVFKYGQTFPISFESSVNDVLGQLADIPRSLAESARRTEQKVACAAYAANALYTTHTVNGVSYANAATGGGSGLTITNLTTALDFMKSLVDDNGEPIAVGTKLLLVVPPKLETTALRILGAQNFILDTNPAAGTAKTRTESPNYIAALVDLVVDPYLPICDPTNGQTAWYLFTPPAQFQAGEVAFLAGQETPGLFMKQPDSIRVSDSGAVGGAANPLDGSFANDTLSYKVRHIVGASLYEWRATYRGQGA